MGLNNRFHITANQPMFLYAKDIDKNNFTEIIPAYYIKNKSENYTLFPALDRNQLAEQLPSVKKKYLLHADYSKILMEQLKSDFGNDGWTVLQCKTSASVWIENLSNGKFKTHQLPVQAQFAPINSIVADDVDEDGNIDLIVAGNEYQTASATGRYDASYGLFVKGDGKGNFTAVNFLNSGLIIDGDVKDLKIINIKTKGRTLIAAPNDAVPKIFLVNTTVKKQRA
jgi:hypothetical protein